MDNIPGALLVTFGTFLVVAAAGFISACAHQWREWRRRRAIERGGR